MWACRELIYLNHHQLVEMHRLPPDVLNVITELLDVKELGRYARTSSVLAAAALFGFEARARERAPGLFHHARRARSNNDWRQLCRKAMSFVREQPPAPRLKAVNEASALNRSDNTFTFTFEAFDGDPADPATTCLLAERAQLSSKRAGQQVSVDGFFPPSVERDRIAFLRVLVSRRKTGEVAVLYSGTATGQESSGGRARWFECYRPPWVDLDLDHPDDTDDDDEVAVTGNGMFGLVWKLVPGEESNVACGAYFQKGMNPGSPYMCLKEVLFHLEYMLVFE